MPATHDAARALAVDGVVEITQKGVVQSPSAKPRGPYRLRVTARAADSASAARPRKRRREPPK